MSYYSYLLILSTTVQKGCGANMLKVGSKRRRTTNEIKEEKEEARLK
jgi:hypothetical protein